MPASVAEKLEDSLQTIPAGGTPRHLYGTVRFATKVVAVVGMRRSGKTTLVHQWRRERIEALPPPARPLGCVSEPGPPAV
jgi:hypothetical protein